MVLLLEKVLSFPKSTVKSNTRPLRNFRIVINESLTPRCKENRYDND